MPSSATRILELKLMIDTSQFDAGIRRVISTMGQLRQAINGLGSANVRISASFGQTANAIRNTGNQASNTHKKMGAWFLATRGGERVYGAGGSFTKAIALTRNYLLLYSFALGGAIAGTLKFIEQAKQTEAAMKGVQSVAEGMGYSVKGVEQLVKKFSDTGLLTVKEAAESIKMLVSMQGMNLDLVEKTMQAAMDWSAFNRLGQYSFGEAIQVFTRGLKEQRSQVTDSIGWVTNLDNAWKRYAASIGKTVGKLSVAEKNIGGITIFLKESSVVAGDAQKLITTYSGAVSKLGVAFNNLRRAMGDVFLPMLSPLADRFTELTKKTEEYVYINKELLTLKIKDFFKELSESLMGIPEAIKIMASGLKENRDYLWDIVESLGQAALIYATVKKLSSIKRGMSKVGLVGTAVGVGLAAERALETYTNRNYDERTKKLSQMMGPLTPEQQARVDAANMKSTEELIALQAQYNKTLEIESIKQADVLKERIKSLENKKIQVGLTRQEEEILKFYNIQLGETNKQIEYYQEAMKSVNHQQFIKDISDITEGLGGLSTILGSKLALGVETFNALSNKSQIDVVNGLRNYISVAKQEYIPTIQKIISFLINEMPKTTRIPKLDEKDTAGANKQRERWLELLEKIKNETKEFYAFGMEKAKLSAETQVAMWRNVAEKAKLGAKERLEAEEVFVAYIKGREYEAVLKSGEAWNKLIDARKKKLKEIQEAVTKGKVSGRQEGMGFFEDIVTEAGKSKFTAYEQALQDIITKRYELAMLLKEEKITVDEARAAWEALNYTLSVTQRTQVVDVANQFKEMGDILANAWIDVQFNIRQEERDTINQLREELNRGTIDQEEYAARVANAHEVAAVRVRNAWNTAGRSLVQSMWSYLSQIITQTYIASRSVSLALSTAFNPTSILLGLGMAAIGGLINKTAYSAMPNYAEPSYQSINPSSSSEAERKRYGSLAAAPVQYINVIPTLNFEAVNGSYILIGSGTVEEFSDEVSELIKNTVNAAIADNEIGLAGLSPQ